MKSVLFVIALGFAAGIVCAVLLTAAERLDKQARDQIYWQLPARGAPVRP